MIQNIEQDLGRFKDIVRGKIKQDLRKFVTNSEMIGKKGKDLVSIPLPRIEIPKFVYGERQKGGVGQGEGKDGSSVGDEEGAGTAGNSLGKHLLEVEVEFDELLDVIGEALELPRIEPKGHDKVSSEKPRYKSISYSGPESLRHFKRTYRQALKRQIMSGAYSGEHPIIIPYREDRRYRVAKHEPFPESKAVIIYMMDVSGSMGNDQKEIVRLEAFWIDSWIRKHYRSVDTRYIIHDAVAREVDRETFYHTRESGGTIISSAYKLCIQMIEEHYSPSDWNVYLFHFSDGDNWSGNDTNECIKLMDEHMLPAANIFCYGQVESEYGSGQFLKDLDEKMKGNEKVITSRIENRAGIVGSIKQFLGKGK